MRAISLRLGPLPRTEPVKLTVTLSAELKVTLDRYAALHAQTYGEATDALALIPHMLAAFMARARGFRRGDAKGKTPLASTKSADAGRALE